jgi:hypothetical protein
VPCPTGSDQLMSLRDASAELARRLARVFRRGADGRRPVLGGTEKFQTDPHWRDLIPFHEYFNGDTGAGVGASHQTGWTALIAKLLHHLGELGEEQLHHGRASHDPAHPHSTRGPGSPPLVPRDE